MFNVGKLLVDNDLGEHSVKIDFNLNLFNPSLYSLSQQMKGLVCARRENHSCTTHGLFPQEGVSFLRQPVSW